MPNHFPISRRRFVEGAVATILLSACEPEQEQPPATPGPRYNPAPPPARAADPTPTKRAEPTVTIEAKGPRYLSEVEPAVWSNGLIYNFDKRISVWCNPQSLTDLAMNPKISLGLPISLVVVTVIVPDNLKTDADKENLRKTYAANSRIKEQVNRFFPQTLNLSLANALSFISVPQIVEEAREFIREDVSRHPRSHVDLFKLFSEIIIGQTVGEVLIRRDKELRGMSSSIPNYPLLEQETIKSPPFRVAMLSRELAVSFGL